MSLFATLAGSDMGATRVRLRGGGEQGISGLTSAADGTGSEGGIIFDDPSADLTVQGWQAITVDEPVCTTAPRLFTGYVADRTYRRKAGSLITSSAREIDTTIIDQNALLSMLLITGSDGKRPAETHIARIDWLLASSYIPGSLITDLGLVDRSNPRPFQASDYRGQYAADVLNDIAGPIFRTFFVYWSQTAHRLGLFFDTPSSTVNTSTLTISNVLGDVSRDSAGTITGTCYPPSRDAILVADPSEVYAKIRYTYRNGTTITNRAATATTFFSGLGYRGLQVNNDRVGLQSTARSMSEGLLDRDSLEAETLTFTVTLPAAKVGLIDAGMRLGVRFSHLPGYTSLTYIRVERRNIVQTEGTQAYYDVQLTCSNHGLTTALGGGDPGGFPYQPPSCTWTKVQEGTPGHVTSLPVAPTVGNKLVILCAVRSSGVFTHPVYTGFHEDEYTSVVDPDGGLNLVYSKTSDGTEQDLATIETTADNKRYVWYEEWTNNGALGQHSNHNQASAAIIGSSAVTVGAHSLVFVMASQAQGSMSIGINGGSGLTTIGQSNIEAGDSGPHTVAGYNADATAGSYNPDFTPSSTGFARPQASLIVEYVCDQSPSDNPPKSGQWFYDIVPTPSPDGSTTTFTLPAGYEFVEGSLLVKVDHYDQTNGVTAQDGAARTFTASWVAKAGQLIQVTGQGI